MSDSLNNIVIIGAGQAAAQAILSLRQGGFEGKITLIGEEPVPPYQRPPLSKAYMKGEFNEERLFFKPSAWYEDNGVDLMLSMTAQKIDREAKRVEMDHGAHADYDALIIATGSRARKLPAPGADLEGVYDLRDLADVQRIKPNLFDGQRMVIVGAGYIGLEAAAVARQMGLHVTVLEMADRVLARVAGPVISEFYEAEHKRQGVDIKCGAALSSIEGEGGKVTGVQLGDGEILPADLVLVGIGIVPNEELAKEAGLDCDNGIVVDEDARTSDRAIFAAGDCASRPLVHYDRRGRLESVHNAIEQGKLAAAAILGQPQPKLEAPWFWSDQYDIKLQIAGLSHGFDQTIVRGDPADRKFAVFYFNGEKLLAVDAINSPPEFVVSKKLILEGAKVDPDQFADTSVSMKEIAAGASN